MSNMPLTPLGDRFGLAMMDQSERCLFVCWLWQCQRGHQHLFVRAGHAKNTRHMQTRATVETEEYVASSSKIQSNVCMWWYMIQHSPTQPSSSIKRSQLLSPLLPPPTKRNHRS